MRDYDDYLKEFIEIKKEKFQKGREEHGDWHIGYPWEWAVWNIIEELADADNYFFFADNSIKPNDIVFNTKFDELKQESSIHNSDLAVDLLQLLELNGNPTIVQQLKEGSYKHGG
jgi:hypothetical protein